MMNGDGRESMRTTPAVLVATLLAAFAASGARAQDATTPDSPLRTLLKGAGIVTDVDQPPDFVVQSRPAQPAASIPAFTTPDEPPGKIKTAKELEEMDSDLTAVSKRHDALRAAYPPSAKAVAEAAAAKKDKSKKKPAAGGLFPTF
jgi:hypothetical protein